MLYSLNLIDRVETVIMTITLNKFRLLLLKEVYRTHFMTKISSDIA